MILFLLILLSVAHGQMYRYAKECLAAANPYTSFNTAENLMKDVDICLARAYLTFPEKYRDSFIDSINICIESIRETDRSKPEYRALQKDVASLTSDAGDSIVETSHVISQLGVCASSLKVVTSIDVYEEARFETIADHFIHQLTDTDDCITGTMAHIYDQIRLVDTRLESYKSKYFDWVNMTTFRQSASEKCRVDFDEFIEVVSRDIEREWHS